MGVKLTLELDQMSNQFELFGLQALNDLQRVFREAKFCRLADDEEISDSPRVAALYEELMVALIARDVAENGEGERANWTRWLATSDQRDEWKIAQERVRAHSAWRNYTVSKKTEYATVLLSPFTLTSETAQLFISQTDAYHR